MSNRYVGIRNGNVYMASSALFEHADPSVEVIEVPIEYQDITYEKLVTDFRVANGKLRLRRRDLPIKKMKLAFVGNWKMQCGIATYSEKLLPEVARHFGDFKLFIERNDQPTGPVNMVGNTMIAPDKVVQCWKRGQPLTDLVNAIKEYDPDIIHIQHEFGIWPNAGYWLSMMSQLSDYQIFVTLHSVFHHKDKTIVEASIPNIIVHLDGARKVLKEEKGVPGTVTIIPHGCTPVVDKERLWNFYHSEKTFLMWGFGFRYKNWEKAIEVTALLKKKHSDVFFTGLFSESPFNKADHQVYHDELMRMVHDLDVTDNVAIIRGYQSDQSLDSYLRTNRIALFPYVAQKGHEVWGASGAARYAMGKLLPVVTTNVNHFSDLPTLKGDTVEDLVEIFDQMFSNPLAYKDQVERQTTYLNDNTWEKIALRHVELYMNMSR